MADFKFYTPFDPPARIPCCAGSDTDTVLYFAPDGSVVDTVTTDLNAKIQANADSGNVALIVEKFMLGDDSYLNESSTFFGDVTAIQDDDIHIRDQKYKDALAFYDGLPDDVKEDFPSVEEFYEKFSYDDLQKIFGSTPEDISVDLGGESSEE